MLPIPPFRGTKPFQQPLNYISHLRGANQVIELFGNGFYSGDLGPSTIVGIGICQDILGVK